MIRGFLSDAHGNVEAFNAGVALLHEQGAGEIYFLGDAIGYLPGIAVLSELVRRGILSIRGNHEAMLLSGNIDPERDKIYGLSRVRSELTRGLADAVAAWPASRTVETHSSRLLLVHGSPRDPTFEYVQPDSPLDTFQVPAGTTVFMGHTHRAFIRKCREVRYVNIGSCAMPRDAPGIGVVALHDDVSDQVRLLRFDIRSYITAAIVRSDGIHPSVLESLQRPAVGDPIGEEVGGR